ncbi:MAG: tyrosine--tRNA ligase [Chlamydiota bacterium]
MKHLLTCLKERELVESIAGEGLEQCLQSSVKIYIGFDPTADSLHLGNLMGMVVLAWCQKFGHTPVILLGGATGKIGDPSGKSKERPILDEATLLHNIACIRKNFTHVLDFSGDLPMPVFVNNDEWFSSFSLIDFLRQTGKHFRVGSMLAKESVKSRVNSEEGMSYTEFSYMLLQSYDFYHLFHTQGVCVQMGGSDQWGNITAGIEFIRKMSQKVAYALTFPLLTRSDGKKFGKSEEGAIWLSKDKLSPYQFYQHLMGIPDADVISLMRKLTFLDLNEIADLEKAMNEKEYVPNTAQKRLASALTELVHGREGLATALKVTEGAAPGSLLALTVDVIEEIAMDMPGIELAKSVVLQNKFTDVVVLAGLVTSKGEATRLIANQGAYLNQARVEDSSRIIEEKDLIGGKYILLGSGKKKKIILRLK